LYIERGNGGTKACCSACHDGNFSIQCCHGLSLYVF